MKLSFSTERIEAAAKGILRVRLVEEGSGVKRFVRESGTELLEIGLGKREEVTRRKFIILCRALVRAAKQHKAKRIAINFADFAFPKLESVSAANLGSLMATAFAMAAFEFRAHKTPPKDGWKDLGEIIVYGASKEAQAGMKRGATVAESVNACRELANHPGGSLTPRGLAKAAKDAAKGLPVTVETLGRAEIKKLGMNLLAGVGAGSIEEPTFTVMKYQGGKPAEKPIVLIGKGITFDSGGLNIKPSSSIYEMHMDMSGGAAVIHALALAAKLKLKKNVVALIPAAENMLGQNAVRPGDILKSLSGKTVEVTDTDAEGRLVLADAITYAKRLKPGVVIDAATLTGAALVALGHHASGLMTEDDALAEELLALGEATGDYLWRLPLWDEYASVLKSEFADLQNHSIGQGRYAGATNGAIFLREFARELGCPWAHLDIVPRMTSASGDELAKGAAGEPVRLLFAFIESSR